MGSEVVRDYVSAPSKAKDAFDKRRAEYKLDAAVVKELKDQGTVSVSLLSAVHFFWADERSVPPEDPESNYRIANELLFDPLAVSPGQIHRIRGEAPPETAALLASGELVRMVPRGPDGFPVLDLAFLGMGEDVHVASLFPGESLELLSSKDVYRSISSAPKPPPQRITLGYGPLAAAREVWVLVSGPGKESALRASLASTGATPLAKVIRSRAKTRVFTDLAVST